MGLELQKTVNNPLRVVDRRTISKENNYYLFITHLISWRLPSLVTETT